MSTNINSLISKAQKHLSKNNLKGALECYEKICKTDSSNYQAWLALGSISGNLGQLDTAENAFKKAYALHKQDKVREMLAQIYEMRGNFENAIDLYIEQLEENKVDNEVQLKIAIAYAGLKDYHSSIKWLDSYLGINNENSYAHYCMASAQSAVDNITLACNHYETAIRLSSDSYQIYNDYAALLQKCGKFEKALEFYKKSIEINPGYFTSQYNIATLYHSFGLLDDATAHFQNALKIEEDSPDALVGLAKSLNYQGHTNRAIDLYDKAIHIDSNCIDAYANLGISLITNADFDRAMESFEKALSLDPENIEVICEIAKLYERRSEYDRSMTLLKPLIDKGINNINLALAYGELSRNINDRDVAIELLNNAYEQSTTPPSGKVTIQYLLGKLYDDLKNYDDAFTHFKLANNLLNLKFDVSKDVNTLKSIRSTFSIESNKQISNSSSNDDTPIFIVGMPRSGTTLVEQILASHPDVHGAGELNYITDIANSLESISGVGYPSCMNNISQDFLLKKSKDYINLVRKDGIKEPRITDKLPHNFFFLGLIEKLFPNATIVHCKRNPIDTCLSIYFSNFNQNHPYATKLGYLADYYAEFYLPLIEHWKHALTIPIHEVNYEELITNQETVTRSILKSCNIKWNDSCLRFYEHKRNVDTISYDQVRKPIYTKSRNRWKNYEKHIKILHDKFENTQQENERDQ